MIAVRDIVREVDLFMKIVRDERPDLLTYAQLSDHVYPNSVDDFLPAELMQWQEVERYDSTRRIGQSGYFGVLYLNPDQTHYVLASRGTRGFRALVADLNGVIRGQHTAQENSLYKFLFHVLRRVSEERKELSLTGHSLGGWLSELAICWYYTHFRQWFPDLHVSATVFDSPGGEEGVGRYIPSQLNPDIIRQWDVMSILSYPNFINSLHQHLGALYHLPVRLDHHGRAPRRAHGVAVTHSMTAMVATLKEISDSGRNPYQILQPMDNWTHNHGSVTGRRQRYYDQQSSYDTESGQLQLQQDQTPQQQHELEQRGGFQRRSYQTPDETMIQHNEYVLDFRHFQYAHRVLLAHLYLLRQINEAEIRRRLEAVEPRLHPFVCEQLMKYELYNVRSEGVGIISYKDAAVRTQRWNGILVLDQNQAHAQDIFRFRKDHSRVFSRLMEEAIEALINPVHIIGVAGDDSSAPDLPQYEYAEEIGGSLIIGNRDIDESFAVVGDEAYARRAAEDARQLREQVASFPRVPLAGRVAGDIRIGSARINRSYRAIQSGAQYAGSAAERQETIEQASAAPSITRSTQPIPIMVDQLDPRAIGMTTSQMAAGTVVSIPSVRSDNPATPLFPHGVASVQIGTLTTSIDLPPRYHTPSGDKHYNLKAAHAYTHCHVGRGTELNTIHQQITRARFSIIMSSTIRSGIGKSTLAHTYAHWMKQQDYYDYIIWLDASNSRILLEDMRQFLLEHERQQMRGDERDYPHTQATIQTFYGVITTQPCYRKTLLIFDNLPAIGGLGSVYRSQPTDLCFDPLQLTQLNDANTRQRLDWVITTPDQSIQARQINQHVNLVPFSQTDSIAYLRHYLPEMNESERQQLAEILGGYPKALELAVISLKRRFIHSGQDYLRLFHEQSAELSAHATSAELTPLSSAHYQRILQVAMRLNGIGG